MSKIYRNAELESASKNKPTTWRFPRHKPGDEEMVSDEMKRRADEELEARLEFVRQDRIAEGLPPDELTPEEEEEFEKHKMEIGDLEKLGKVKVSAE